MTTSAPLQMRVAELVAALSLATDIGTGRSMDHALRTCLISTNVARALGLEPAEVSTVYYAALLRFVGCTADASEAAVFAGGDDVAFTAGFSPHFMGSNTEAVRYLVRNLGEGRALPTRVKLVAGALTDTKGADRAIAQHCEVACMLATRAGLPPGVSDALASAFERWDGKGNPHRVPGEQIPLAARIVAAARDTDVWLHLAGPERMRSVLRERRGKAYDPDVVDALAEADLSDVDDPWEAVLEAEPEPRETAGAVRIEEVLACFADFTDLKSIWLRGHSRAVAELAAEAAAHAGGDEDMRQDVRRAGLVHDLGRVGIASGIWDAPRPLTRAEWERVRLHPYLTERILARCGSLAGLAPMAGAHHERCDGSGYHKGLGAAHLPAGALILAAADAFCAMTEQRPHRPALTRKNAARALWRQMQDGHLGRPAVDAVLAAAGQRPGPRRGGWPSGLTDREVEVLRLIARGRTNREVAAALTISPKTAGHHVAHVYSKIGVSTRAGAALFAMERGLM